MLNLKTLMTNTPEDRRGRYQQVTSANLDNVSGGGDKFVGTKNIKDIDPDAEISFHFTAMGEKGRKHKIVINFPKGAGWDKPVRGVCDCGDFTYRQAYLWWNNDSYFGVPPAEIKDPPRETNTLMIPYLCKHFVAIVNALREYNVLRS